MDNLSRRLLIQQLDKKLTKFEVLKSNQVPPRGWIHTIRTSLNMSLAQLARSLNKSAVTVREIEEREQNKNITLNKLIEVGNALDLQFVYGFIPKHGSIEKMIEQRALRVARDIVTRTSHTMKLEDQENSEDRVQDAIQARAASIQQEMPKYLWD